MRALTVTLLLQSAPRVGRKLADEVSLSSQSQRHLCCVRLFLCIYYLLFPISSCFHVAICPLLFYLRNFFLTLSIFFLGLYFPPYPRTQSESPGPRKTAAEKKTKNEDELRISEHKTRWLVPGRGNPPNQVLVL